MRLALSRRALLGAGGALVVGVLADGAHSEEAKGKLPGSLASEPRLSSWVQIAPDGAVTVFTGKAELGQGIRTALMQVAAEQLDLEPAGLTLVTADTGRTPNEGYTAGSHSMQDSGTAILHAAAAMRAVLVQQAAARWGLDPAVLTTAGGRVAAPDGRSAGYGELVGGVDGSMAVPADVVLKPVDRDRVMGQPVRRVDIPAKVTGGAAYVQDMRLPGMVHARVVRPPRAGARLLSIEAEPIEAMPGVLRVVRDGSYLAVIAEREWQAITAMRALAAAARWSEGRALPAQDGIYETLRGLPSQATTILDRRADRQADFAPAVKTVRASYRRPYGMHASIGPSCAVAQLVDGQMTVWTHTQGVYPDRAALAELLRMKPEQVRCIHVEGAGCYGHNGADDAGADAALLARALPGRPVRVQWMREQENLWEPYTPAMSADAEASLAKDGSIVYWNYAMWSNTHNMRPGNGGRLMPSWLLAEPLEPSPPQPIPQPEGGGDRNGIPLYDLPAATVVSHFIPEMPLRVSAMRGLGAYTNVFAIESFMDELAAAAGLDPVAFRLKHLSDARARAVIERAAAAFDWAAGPVPGRGRGLAFSRYKNLGAYCAVALEVSVEHETGAVRVHRAECAVDSGHAVNPDGIRNQIGGGVIQSISWTLFEAVQFGPGGVTSRDWGGYPILRFDAVPERVEVHVIDRPGMPFLGTGEAAQGPTAAAIANAVAQATGVRVRELPLSAARVKAAIGV